jgi:hypothetical protein
MYRTLLAQLLEWKNQPSTDRMPMLLDGARQVGKSYLLEHLFGRIHFNQVVKLDFLAEPELALWFVGSKNPQTILDKMQLALGIDFNPKADLLLKRVFEMM